MQVYETKAFEGLEKLNLTTASANLDTVSQTASAENWSYTHFLGYLLEGELQERHRRTVEMSLQFARFTGHQKIDRL